MTSIDQTAKLYQNGPKRPTCHERVIMCVKSCLAKTFYDFQNLLLSEIVILYHVSDVVKQIFFVCKISLKNNLDL